MRSMARKQLRRAVWFGFFTLIATTIIMQMALLFNPLDEPFPLQVQGAMETLFGLMPRIALGSLCAYFVSQFLDVKIYSVLKRLCPAPNQLWIRNNGSTAVSQLVDTFIFCTIAFAGASGYDSKLWLSIFLSTYVIKFIVSLCSTPFLYAARSFTFQGRQHQDLRVSRKKKAGLPTARHPAFFILSYGMNPISSSITLPGPFDEPERNPSNLL